MPKTFLKNLSRASIANRVAQKDGVSWMQNALLRANEGNEDHSDIRKACILYERLRKNPAIEYRQSILKDYTHRDWGEMELYQSSDSSPWYLPTIDRRMKRFHEASFDHIQELFPQKESPDAIIQVSCTGYDAPSPTQKLCLTKEWFDTQLISLGHMGCYAAVPAVWNASQYLNQSKYETLAVYHSEFCTLHLDVTTKTPSSIVTNCLFSDGAIRYDVSSIEDEACFRVIDHFEHLIPDSQDMMTWSLGPSHFQMFLSKGIPNQLAERAPVLVESILNKLDLSIADIDWWGIHPGGIRVIESLGDVLSVLPHKLQFSHEILKSFGNMSSCTLPYVWDQMLNSPQTKRGDIVCSMAFGPGLTFVGNIMEIRK